MLNKWWSIDWWLPRHLQKLDEVKTHKNAQVIFVGDSITQGWERDGFNVWNHNYAKYNAVALGFGGDRTENILWRLQQGEVEGLNPKVAVLTSEAALKNTIQFKTRREYFPVDSSRHPCLVRF